MITGAKYHEDITRCKEIGRLLDPMINRSSKSRGRAAQKFASYTGLGGNTASLMLTQYCISGPPAQKISSESRLPMTSTHLFRLAILYHLLNIAPRGKIATLTREINPKFVYPLENTVDQESQSLEALTQ